MNIAKCPCSLSNIKKLKNRKKGSKKTGGKQFRVDDIEALMNTIIIR